LTKKNCLYVYIEFIFVDIIMKSDIYLGMPQPISYNTHFLATLRYEDNYLAHVNEVQCAQISKNIRIYSSTGISMLFYHSRALLFLTIISFFLVSNYSLAATEMPEDPGTNGAIGTIGVDMRVGDSVSELAVEAILPLWQSPISSVFFAPGFTSYNNDYQDEIISLGLGVRRLFDGLGVIAGGNIYYDHLKSVDGYSYDQLGLGIELLSEWVDISINYYLPEDTVNKTGRYSLVSQTEGTTSSWGAVYGEGYQLLQDMDYSKETTTTTRLFEYFEEAMDGLDLETAIKVPGVPDWLEARILFGWYHYDGSNDHEIEGYKVGCEVRPVRGISIETVYYEDEALHGDNLLVEASLRVPFSFENLFKGENPFPGISQFFKTSERNLNDRLLDGVRRDAIIPIQDSGPIENIAAKTVSQETEEWSDTYTIMSDVVFVDGDSDGTSQDGTYENPFSEVQLGVDAAFGEQNVYVNAFSGQYLENVTLSEGVSLLGSGTLIEGYDSQTFGSGIQPIINGGGEGPVVTVAGNNIIDGFYLINTDSVTGSSITETFPDGSSISEDLRQVGIWGNGVSGDIQISNNSIETAGHGIYLATTGGTISVTDNILTQPADASLGNMVKVSSYGDGLVEASFSDNVFSTLHDSSTSWGVMFYAYENSVMDVSFKNNQIDSAGTALVLTSYGTSTLSANVTNNILSSNQWSGMRLGSSDTGSIQVSFIENTINAITNGIYFSPSSTNAIVLDGYGNTINYGSGFEAVESIYPATAVVNNLIYP
jgi:hypothetical protein